LASKQAENSPIRDVATTAAPTPTAQSENPYANEQRKMIETVVNVMLPLDTFLTTPEAEEAEGESFKPQNVDVTRMRKWLREKLTAIGFAPETDANRESFRDYLAHYSDTEQKQAFGAENIAAYRRGDMTPAKLMAQQSNETPLDKFRDMSPVTEFTTKQIERVGSAGAQRTLERRARRASEALGLEVAESEVNKTEAKFISQVGVAVVKTAANYQQEKNQSKKGKWINGEGRLVSVEEIAGEWYQARGYSVLRCEGTIISVWVATFLATAVQDRNDPRLRTGFRTTTRDWKPQRQNAPLIPILLPDDFASAGYYQRREAAIQTSIQRMRSTENLRILFEELLDGSESLRDYLWVNDAEPVEAARIALNIVPREMVIACVNWAIKQFWQRRRGWPDLFVYTAESFAFAEVKAPHDHLAPEQMNWFRWAIDESHIPCELCHVAKR
jgi:hypothetical protein